MANLPLEVVGTSRDVVEMAVAAYCNEAPGFQVDERFARKVGTCSILDSIEEASELALGAKVPFTYLPFGYNEPGYYAPHLDGGFKGLSVHRNLSGRGFVELAHLTEETDLPAHEGRIFLGDYTGAFNNYKGGGIDVVCAEVGHGDIYRGDLEVDRLTVFSQGNLEGLLRAIHYFRRTTGGIGWIRYSSNLSDNNLTQAQLDALAGNFRLSLLDREYSALINERCDLERYLEDPSKLPFNGSEDDIFDWLGIRHATLEEIDAELKVHQGRRIVSLGTDNELGVKFKKLNPVIFAIREGKATIRNRFAKR